MRKIGAVTIGFALTMPATAGAHRLDELLQATRVAVARDHAAIEIDLTPGVTVAPDVFSLIDRDANHQVSGAEAEAYARGVLNDVVLEVDGRVLSLRLMHAEVPSRTELIEGGGTIRLEAVAETPPAHAGRHRLVFRNQHQAERAVYLVNALAPGTPDIAIGVQTRDPRQREIRIEYDVRDTGFARVSWLMFGALSLSALVVFRRH